jgi:hypothetical protein
VGQAIGLWLKSFTDPDDLIGVRVLVWAAVDPSLGGLSPLPPMAAGPVNLSFTGDGAHYDVHGEIVHHRGPIKAIGRPR